MERGRICYVLEGDRCRGPSEPMRCAGNSPEAVGINGLPASEIAALPEALADHLRRFEAAPPFILRAENETRFTAFAGGVPRASEKN